MLIAKASDQFVETEVDGELVLMNVATGDFFGLKGTGLAIWKLIDQHEDVTAIKEALQSDYDVSEADCAAEVDEFVRELVHAKLLVVR